MYLYPTNRPIRIEDMISFQYAFVRVPFVVLPATSKFVRLLLVHISSTQRIVIFRKFTKPHNIRMSNPYSLHLRWDDIMSKFEIRIFNGVYSIQHVHPIKMTKLTILKLVHSCLKSL